jgi:uncharacterized membrane protein YccC
MRIGAVWQWLCMQAQSYQVQLRFCVRMTAAAIVAFIIGQFFSLPLRGLWVVLTAVVVTQLSIGGSLGASVEYVLGTLGGAVYGGLIGVLIPHNTELAQIGVLAIGVAPLAFAAALNPNFRVAPFSAALVIMISGQLGEGPFESALLRLAEVTLGGAVAVTVSLLVFPERADRLALQAAANVLEQMAKALPQILAAFLQSSARTELRNVQDQVGGAVSELQAIVEQVRRERPITFTSAPDPAPLPRTLLRLRHDFVMIGRASADPLPVRLAEELEPRLDRAGAVIADYFHACAVALISRHPPPPLAPLQAALAGCASEIATLREHGLAHLSASQFERLFALGFALEQLQRNIIDLERCVQEWSLARRSSAHNPPPDRDNGMTST